MVVEMRRAEILAIARRSGGVGLRELSSRFCVSIPTIRRDLAVLAARGLLCRVHGGAIPLASAPAGRRSTADLQAAASLVEAGMAIGLSGWRRAAALAGLIADVPDLTVVTPMLAVARAVRAGGPTLLVIGGVRTPSGSHAGPLAEDALHGLHLDIAFVEPTTSGDALAAATDDALLRRAARRVLL
ncbi:DeoR family transcriptional regulator [Dactylosporangium cerinum]|uniref:DeoR family transcriptional regulator n=1 Tax=Dactylosporangium cerinum TaxID=1434730 RepID=A0ABV9W595_9ACTN